MSKLKIELFRYESLVFGRVLEMDDKLREEGILAEGDGFAIHSNMCPELEDDELCVRGGNGLRDNDIFSYTFDSKEEATKACNKIKELVNEINKEDITNEGDLPIIKINFNK